MSSLTSISSTTLISPTASIYSSYSSSPLSFNNFAKTLNELLIRTMIPITKGIICPGAVRVLSGVRLLYLIIISTPAIEPIISRSKKI
jgi:hypothetical protein